MGCEVFNISNKFTLGITII